MQLTLGATTRPWNQWTFAEACQAIAAAGYTDVAPFAHDRVVPLTADSTFEDVAAVRRVVEAAGLEPSMLITNMKLQLPRAEAAADYRKVIDVAAEAGVTWVMNCGCADESLFTAYNDLFRECAPYAAEKGVHLVMKPHGGNGLTGRMMREVVEAVGHPNFTLCYDPGNIIYYTRGGLRPEIEVEPVKDQVSVCIIKDCVVVGGKPDVQVLPGEGLVDFDAVLGILMEAGFRGPLYVECLGGTEWDDINDRAVRTREFIGGILDGLG